MIFGQNGWCHLLHGLSLDLRYGTPVLNIVDSHRLGGVGAIEKRSCRSARAEKGRQKAVVDIPLISPNAQSTRLLTSPISPMGKMSFVDATILSMPESLDFSHRWKGSDTMGEPNKTREGPPRDYQAYSVINI
jgi:hypothetical protein